MTLDLFVRGFLFPSFLLFAIWGLYAIAREAFEGEGKRIWANARTALALAWSSTWTATRRGATSALDAASRLEVPTMPWRW